MRRAALILILASIATILVLPAVAQAETRPADGSIVTGFPIQFTSTDLTSTNTAYFKVDGVTVATVRPSIIWAWDEEAGDDVPAGYRASAAATVADGYHTLTVVQGGVTRYTGRFAMDARPVLKGFHWGGDGIHIVVADNGTSITTNAYKYDKTGSGASMVTVPGSLKTVAGVTTVERMRAHALCCDLGDGWCCDIHGISVKITDGYSPVSGRMTIDWPCLSVDEPTCAHYGDNDPESIMEHYECCLLVF